VKASAKEGLRAADAPKAPLDVQRERDEPVVIGIGQLTLGLRPDKLVGIELRRVARKAVHHNPGMSLEKGPDVVTPMNFPAIPQQNERAVQMAEKLAEERDHLGARDVAHVEIEVQPESLATRGHSERRDDRNFVTPVATSKERRVPDGRPGLAHVWNQ
jgi:hypothetical protein